MKTAIIGFPRIGENRELKFATEKYFRGELAIDELEAFAKDLRQKHWQLIKKSGIDGIPSNDFSFYDTTLDTACLLNIVPQEVTALNLTESEKYFALARGYQGEKGDIKARPMKKWFNTNYHYIVPKFEKETTIFVSGDKIFREYHEAKALGIETRPVIIGPFTLLQLSEFDQGVDREKIIGELIKAYKEIFEKLADLGAEWIQLDEPSLVKDVTKEELTEFQGIYQELLADQKIKVLLQSYFGDIRDAYDTVVSLLFAGIGLDFIEGRKTLELVKRGFPQDKVLFAGVVNGKNIWRNNYQQTLDVLKQIKHDQLVLTTSCSLLHVPFTTENETFSAEINQHFAFAKEKLAELVELANSLAGAEEALKTNQALFAGNRFTENQAVQAKINALTEKDYLRKPAFEQRETIQKAAFDYPVLPTTTIGSFPQTREGQADAGKVQTTRNQ